MTDEVPESTRRYVRENREDLEYILKHGSSLELRAYAGALLLRGLTDPEVDQVIDELQEGRRALQ